MPVQVPNGTTETPKAVPLFDFTNMSIILDRKQEEIEAFKSFCEFKSICNKYLAISNESKLNSRIGIDGKELHTYGISVSRMGSSKGFNVIKTASSMSLAQTEAYEEAIVLITGMKDGKVVRDEQGKPVIGKLCDPGNPMLSYKTNSPKMYSLKAYQMQVERGAKYEFVEYRSPETGEYLATIPRIMHHESVTEATATLFRVPDSHAGSFEMRELYYAQLVIRYLKGVPIPEPKTARKAIESSGKYDGEELQIKLANVPKTLALAKQRVVNDLGPQYLNILSVCCDPKHVAKMLENQKEHEKAQALEAEARKSIEASAGKPNELVKRSKTPKKNSKKSKK